MLIKLLHLGGESQLLDLEGWEPEKVLTVDLEHGLPTSLWALGRWISLEVSLDADDRAGQRRDTCQIYS